MHDAGILYEGCRINSGTTGIFSRNERKRNKQKKAYEDLLSPKQGPKEVQLLLVNQVNHLPEPDDLKSNESSPKVKRKNRHPYTNHHKNYPWLFTSKPKKASLTSRNFGQAEYTEYRETMLTREVSPPTIEEIATLVAKCPSKKHWIEAWKSATDHPFLSFGTFFESLNADEELLAKLAHSPA